MIEIMDPQTGELMDTDSVPGLAAVAGLHSDQIYQLSMVVAQLEEADAASGSAAPWTWRTLRGHPVAAQWRDLADWVGWLRGRYPLARQIPLCWWRHPELVEELTALWLAWKDAYATKHAHFSAPAEWHARWLPDFLRRVGAGGWNVSCEGEHKERVDGLYDGRRVDDEDAFAAHVADPTPLPGNNESTKESEMAQTIDQESMTAAIESGKPDVSVRWQIHPSRMQRHTGCQAKKAGCKSRPRTPSSS